MYRCRTLGELALYADAEQSDPLLRSGKSLAVLVYLGLTPTRSDSRERIARLFWPNADPPDVHHALRQALYRMRQAASGPPPIEQQDGLLVYSLDTDVISRRSCVDDPRSGT